MDCKYAELSKAQSVDDVVRVTCDYLAGWSRDDLERLPDTCRPAWVRGPQDIELWADRLADEAKHAMLVLEDERRLDRLTSHFLIASVRIRQLTMPVAVPVALAEPGLKLQRVTSS
jgi:hypothetical protein